MMSPQLKKAMVVSMIMGGELTVFLLIGVFAGYYGGGYFNFAEWGATIGAFVAFMVWTWVITKTIKKLL